ncbi:hypothetical protein P153DRAFT_418111 [Dothidotthia symphoricarpi CBS 119687]|uniref:DUF3176 domain-containing protein n=1 Tax=Dothidotthia symphoricarpi CBS 119687 TaxID=1392245 RepID=A0A6A6AHF0_9PLEO|nr:uncharacterized protein P153DRAFT_418111 [Dothidotthia symphoricarpi CBS 119687]KAF2130498.1 hypothetical protein P153DRAFT_418111 [Dothidotthia symphoricarpi CBS 119687]
MACRSRGEWWWPIYPGIPIYLEAHDERATAKTYGTTPTTPTTPETTPIGRPTYLSPAYSIATQPSSTQPSPIQSSPTRLSPTTTIQTSSDRSDIWPVPEPPPEIQQQESRRPALRFFPSERPRIRLDCASSLQIPQINEKTPINNTHSSLGIAGGSPKPPSIEISLPLDEDVEASPNIAERIEKRLYQYSISSNILKIWLLEIISWVFSAVCMAAVIIVLIYLKDDPLANWSLTKIPGLTLNAYISLLSRMAGAALIIPVSEALGQLKWSWFQQNSKQMWDFEIFDNASRGPWGSLLLLVRTKGKALAALGAMITMCMMALDPFFQQVVDFPDRWTLQDTLSAIPRTTHYERSFGREYRDGFEVATDDPDMFLVVEKFSYGNGTEPVVFGNGTRPEIPLSCPTSKCTWPLYETLGVCSQCADISSHLTFACLTTKVDWTSNTTGGFGDVESEYPNSTMCGYFLNVTSATPILMSGYLFDTNTSTTGEALLSRTLPLTTLTTREPLYGNGSINFKQDRNTIFDVLIVTAANGSAETVYRNEPPIAQECVLSWCVKTIRSSYDWGKYEEEVVKTVINTTAGPFPWVGIPYSDESGNGTDIFYLQDINIDVVAPPSKDQDTSIDLATLSSGPNILKFGTSNNTASAIIQGFTDIFPSFSTVLDDPTTPVLRYKVWDDGPAWNRYLGYNPWLGPNVPRHLERLATAMTNVIRSADNKEMISGEAFSRVTYVSVRWQWLTLPIGLLLLTFVFLAATIFKSAHEKAHVGVMKNSAILTLLYGLPDDMRRRLTRSSSTGAPKTKEVKGLKVKRNRNMGWTFSESFFPPLTPRLSRHQHPPGWI